MKNEIEKFYLKSLIKQHETDIDELNKTHQLEKNNFKKELLNNINNTYHIRNNVNLYNKNNKRDFKKLF